MTMAKRRAINIHTQSATLFVGHHVLCCEVDIIANFVISLHKAPNLSEVAERWRTLEHRGRPSFFQSWSWLGCLAQERFPHPMLLVAQKEGVDVGLGLFNLGSSRFAPRTLWLGETGQRAYDAMYVEHNGFLLADGFEDCLQDCLQDCLRAALPHRIVLSGVDDAHLNAARGCGGVVHMTGTQSAPFVDLAALPTGRDGVIENLGSSTRAQLRRSIRRYEQSGPLELARAHSVESAMAMFAELETLHQASWTARGKPGVFSNPVFRRFHTALIAEAFPRSEIEMLRISAGNRLIGCLYHFRHGGHVLSYQSGFAPAEPHDKPGLVCHLLAVDDARSRGAVRYDFLAGTNRTKMAFANSSVGLHWLDVVSPWSARGIIKRLGLRRQPP